MRRLFLFKSITKQSKEVDTMIFSFSRLNLYEECPYRFYNKYILKKDEPLTQPLALGKAVHKAIEDKIKGVNHEPAVLNGYMEAEFHSGLNYDDISELTANAPVQPGMGQTEIHFKLPLSDAKDAPMIQGYIDVVQPKGSIIDWKTNRIPYDVQDTQQVALYCWAISNIKNLDKVRGSYYFLRFRKESSYVFTRKRIGEARTWALGLANEINEKLDLYSMFPERYKELFPAKPSRMCNHCPFSVNCVQRFHVLA